MRGTCRASMSPSTPSQLYASIGAIKSIQLLSLAAAFFCSLRCGISCCFFFRYDFGHSPYSRPRTTLAPACSAGHARRLISRLRAPRRARIYRIFWHISHRHSHWSSREACFNRASAAPKSRRSVALIIDFDAAIGARRFLRRASLDISACVIRHVPPMAAIGADISRRHSRHYWQPHTYFGLHAQLRAHAGRRARISWQGAMIRCFGATAVRLTSHRRSYSASNIILRPPRHALTDRSRWEHAASPPRLSHHIFGRATQRPDRPTADTRKACSPSRAATFSPTFASYMGLLGRREAGRRRQGLRNAARFSGQLSARHTPS